MSRKSRPPKAEKASRGKKKRGRKGEAREETTYIEEVVEQNGPPFGLVVLIALLLTLPAIMQFFDGSMEFRPAVVRFLAALLISWLLCALVYSVVSGFSTEHQETSTTHRSGTEPPDGYPRPGAYPDSPGDPRAPRDAP